jgi:hypothetical protein
MLMMGKGDASAPLSCWLGSFHPSFMATNHKLLQATERKASEQARKQQNSSVSAFFSFVPSFIHSLKESDSP